jgi:hypothetical protein
MQVADRHGEVIERGQRVTILGLKAGQSTRKCDSLERLPLSRAITRIQAKE